MKTWARMQCGLAMRLLRDPEAAAAVAPDLDRVANRPWFDYPLGREVRATADEYRALHQQARDRQHPEVDAWEQGTGYAVDSDWFHELALLTQIVIKKSVLCYQHGRLLYSAMRQLIERQALEHVNVIETGTARAFSSLCMARAMADAGVSGTIHTFDVLPHDVAMYWNCIRDADGPCSRAELLGDYTDLLERHVVFHQGDTRLQLPKVKVGRVHMAFLDGAHTYDDVMHEFSCIRDCQRPGDVLFFDDYTDNFTGVMKAVDEIIGSPLYDGAVVEAMPTRRYVIATRTS